METTPTGSARWQAGAAIRLLLLTAGLLVLVAACSRPGSQPSSNKQQQAAAKALAYSKCMRSHGEPNYPDPTTHNGTGARIGPNTGIDPNSPQFKAAAQACHNLQPGPGSMSPQQIAQARRDGLKTANCMHRHGFPTFPDPNGQGVIQITQANSPQQNSPKFQHAMSACQKGNINILQGPGGGASR